MSLLSWESHVRPYVGSGGTGGTSRKGSGPTGSGRVEVARTVIDGVPDGTPRHYPTPHEAFVGTGGRTGSRFRSGRSRVGTPSTRPSMVSWVDSSSTPLARYLCRAVTLRSVVETVKGTTRPRGVEGNDDTPTSRIYVSVTVVPTRPPPVSPVCVVGEVLVDVLLPSQTILRPPSRDGTG